MSRKPSKSLPLFYKERVAIPTFFWCFDVVITNRFRESAVKLIDLDGQEMPDDSVACTISPKNSRRVYVFFRPDAHPGVVAHEAWHCVRRMLSYCGAELEEEVVAYHIEHLVDQFLDVLKKARKRGELRPRADV